LHTVDARVGRRCRVVRIGGVEQCAGERREGLGGGAAVAVGRAVGTEAGEDTHDIAIDDGGVCAEVDARDRGGGVGPDARQAEPLFGAARRLGKRGQRAGEFVEVARATVVAEALPEL